MSNPSTPLSVFLGLAILLSGCGGSRSRLKVGKAPQGEVVEAEGLAPYEPKDLIKTKRGSLVDAQRNAVEKAVGVFVSARTLVEKAVAIENNILANTDGYIKKYDILNEGVQGDLYQTRIRALVAIKDLESDLKGMALLKTPELKRPRLSVEVSDKVDGKLTSDGVASSALQKSLIDQGFVVVTGERIKEAELKVTGEATAFPFQSSGLGGFVSSRARLSLQVTRPGVQDIVLTATKEASGLGGNAELAALKALETVGNLVGTEIAQRLPEVSPGKNILVYVEGVTAFSDVDRVKKHIASQPGVSDLMLRLYDENMAQFEVQLASIQSMELASELEQSKTLALKVLESKPQHLRLKLE